MLHIVVKIAFVVLVCCGGSVLGGEEDEFALDKNTLFIENYAKEHSDAIRLPSGVIYRILQTGAEEGGRVVEDQACQVRYIGTTLSGDVFIKSRKQGTLSSNVVPSELSLLGFREALSLMKEGDHWEVVIPAHLAYGDKSQGKYVKPGATVVLDLEVELSSGAGMSVWTRQALGAAFMLVYGLYSFYHNKQQVTPANAGPSLQAKDVSNAPGHPTVFLQIAVGNTILDRVEIELFSSICPKTAENFRCLCTGEKGMCKTTGEGVVPLHLKDSVFHRVIPGFMCQGGDLTKRDGTGGESIYGATFPDEWGEGAVLHSESFLLSMANCGADTNSSQFFITLEPVAWLDRKHVVFGRVKSGFEAVKAVEAVGSTSGSTSKLVRIIDCGEVKIKKSALKKE